MTGEVWVAIYAVVGLVTAIICVTVMNRIDPVSGDDNPMYVGLPVFLVWPVVWIAIAVLFIYDKARKLRAG